MAGKAAMATISDPLVMYVIVRTDLLKAPLNWPLGSVIAQGAHAATAAMWKFRDDPNTVAYGNDLGRMHKVVLAAKDQADLQSVADSLTGAGIDHYHWLELPESVPTAIATKPYPKPQYGDVLKRLKLLR